jgi:predicted Zn-dependent protease
MSDARIAQFTALVEKHPTNEMFRFSLAQALDQAGRTDEAIPHYQACVDAKADWMIPRIILGKLLLKAGDKAAAKPLLEAALQLAIAQDHEDPAMELRTILAELA